MNKDRDITILFQDDDIRHAFVNPTDELLTTACKHMSLPSRLIIQIVNEQEELGAHTVLFDVPVFRTYLSN